jgi:hypothetical protein
MPFSTNKIFIHRFAGRVYPPVIQLSEIEIDDKIDFIAFINITDRRDACPTSVGWAFHQKFHRGRTGVSLRIPPQ